MRKYGGMVFLIISILFVIIVMSSLFLKRKQYQAERMPPPPTIKEAVNNKVFYADLTSEELEIHEQNKIILANSIQYQAEDIVNRISDLVIRLARTDSMSCNEVASAEKTIPPGGTQYYWHLTMKDGTTYWINTNGWWAIWKENIAGKNVLYMEFEDDIRWD